VCGRFSFAVKARIIEEQFSVKAEGTNFRPRYNCAPSQNLAVISNRAPDAISYFRWGLIPFWAKESGIGNKMINAKAETITEKPSYRDPFRKRRCLVPADSFYEWQHDSNKEPYRILMKDESPFTMAGIWDIWHNTDGEEICSFSIITTTANDLVAGIHHRMPVILKREDGRVWLNDSTEENLCGLLKPYPAEAMKAYKIGKMVNSPGNDDEEIWNEVK
jgi:putative SOS response-associated peptidase YedK